MSDEAADRESRADEVKRTHRLLRGWIKVGELAPGAIISQVQLADRLGVSRAPLREALRFLESEGFVEQQHNRRARVASVSLSDLDQLYAMRISLESLAVRIATPRQTAQQVRRARSLLCEMERCIQRTALDEWEEPHRAFHAALTAPAGERLARELSALSDHADRYRRIAIGAQPATWLHGSGEHEEILQAVESGDGDLAAVLLAKHLGRVALIAAANIDSLHELTAVRSALRTVESLPDTMP